MADTTSGPYYTRLACWSVFVAAIAAINYFARFSGGDTRHGDGVDLYSYSAFAGAFAANVVLFTVVAPFVEELTFRGAGQSLLRFLGRTPSILLIGCAFGLTHGLVEALLILIPFGIALAWIRDRTESVVPGMFVHGVFNGAALAAVVIVN